MNDINYDFKNICRTCLFDCDLKFTLNNIISDVVFKLTNIQFETNDELPQQICLKCFERINAVHLFALQCKQTNFSLVKYLKNVKNNQTNEEINVSIKIEEEERLEEGETSKNEQINNELEIKQEFEEVLIPESSEINFENCNYFPEDVLSCPPETESNDIFLNLSIKDLSEMAEDKQYKCDVCEKSFTYLKAFERHKKIPNCACPFKCNVCAKSFAQSVLLKRHMRVHSGERPYKCSKCRLNFAGKEHFTKHLLVHRNERPYKCSVCEKTFKIMGHMIQHQKVHFRERPFKCEQCGGMFETLSFLEKHEKVQHKHMQYIYEVS